METADPGPKAADSAPIPAEDLVPKPDMKPGTRRRWTAEDKAWIAAEAEKDGPTAGGAPV